MLQDAQRPPHNEKKPARGYGAGFILFVAFSLLLLAGFGILGVRYLIPSVYLTFVRKPPAYDYVLVWIPVVMFLGRLFFLLMAMIYLRKRNAAMFLSWADLFLAICLPFAAQFISSEIPFFVGVGLCAAYVVALYLAYRYVHKSKALARYFADGQKAPNPPPDTESK